MNKTRLFSLLLLIPLLITACGSGPVPDESTLDTIAPDFTLENALGGQTSLSDFDGQPVLLYFHMAVG